MNLSPKISDWIGISSAILCTLHCLVAPVFFGGILHVHGSGTEHWLLAHHWDYVFLILGFGAVWFSARHAHNKLLKTTLWITYGILAGAILLEEFGWVVQLVIYCSSAALVIAHILNLRHTLKPALYRQSS
ncbi:MAG: MerC domain-containing protein [Bacteroidota bacterium]